MIYTLLGYDLYVQDNIANGNFDHDVAGIGRIDASNIQNDSRGTGIIEILNPSSLTNNKFLIWGHDTGAQVAGEYTDVPVGVQSRLFRKWRVSEVDTTGAAISVGSVDVQVDLTGMGSVTASDLRLLVDINNDNSFTDETVIGGGVISGATNVTGSIYKFAGVTVITNNLRFSLGTINTTSTPLPIELLNFNAVPEDNKYVQLSWQTATETNNNYFIIEKSKEGVKWEEVKIIAGAGNSNSLLSYSETDYEPYHGLSYYRLKQVDFDGKFSYSQMKEVIIKTLNDKLVEIYPNPASTDVTVKGDLSELKEIKIFNVLGEDVTRLVAQTMEDETHLILNVADLNKGTYYLKTKTTTSRFSVQ